MTFDVTYEWFKKEMDLIVEFMRWYDTLWDTDIISEKLLDRLGVKLDQPVRMLAYIMNDKKDHWIEYWLYDLDAGKKWEPGLVEDENGNDIKLETIEDLWNVLTNYD